MKVVLTKNAPAPVGPYSQAIEVGNMVYCSGQIPLNPETGAMVGTTAAEQAEQVITNMEAVLQAAGLSLQHVVKTTIFMVDLGAFGAVNGVYEKRFGTHKPARSTVQVSALPKGALVEIECIATR